MLIGGVEEKFWANRSTEKDELFIGLRIGWTDEGELTTSRYVARWLAMVTRKKIQS